MLIAVDFDGTIVTHKYPKIGDEIPFAIDTLKMLRQDGHRLILWSVREGELLDEAVEYCRQRGLEFYAINRDYPEETTDNNPHFSRKLKVDVFIDDRNIGGLPDWGTIYKMIKNKHKWDDVIDEIVSHTSMDHSAPPKKKHWWQFEFCFFYRFTFLPFYFSFSFYEKTSVFCICIFCSPAANILRQHQECRLLPE